MTEKSKWELYKEKRQQELSQAAQNISIPQDPEKPLISSGYDQGEYITYFNILNKQIGSELQQLYIAEISSDRTEIRLDSTSLTDSDIVEQANIFIQERRTFYERLGNGYARRKHGRHSSRRKKFLGCYDFPVLCYGNTD